MAKNLVNKVGEIGQDNLFAHVYPRALTTGVKIASGENVLPRGTILFTEDEGATFKALTSGNEAKANCILADDVDATEEAVVAAAYISGNFNIHAVAGKPEDEVEIGYSVQDALRHYNIILSEMQE